MLTVNITREEHSMNFCEAESFEIAAEIIEANEGDYEGCDWVVRDDETGFEWLYSGEWELIVPQYK